MKLSIVIPAKNEIQLLPNLLAAIKKQKGVEYEVILADAHSTDGTRELARDFGVKVVDGGMPGPGRNLGAKHATGEWICFHDADMVPLDDRFYEKALKEFADFHGDFGTAHLVPDQKTWLDRGLHWLYHLNTKITAPFVAHIPGGCFFVKRAWHERVGGFDETVVFAEDMEYAQRLKKLGAHFVYLSDLLIEISVRRLKKDGYFSIIGKFIYAEWYMRFCGPIRKDLFTYSFDHSQTKRS